MTETVKQKRREENSFSVFQFLFGNVAVEPKNRRKKIIFFGFKNAKIVSDCDCGEKKKTIMISHELE